MELPQDIPLGPFILEAPIGKGGMCEVWRGRHHQGPQVAVKVILGEDAQKPQYIKAFQNEVRAVAALQHPSIVQVYDYGQVTEQAEKASQGKLQAQSPYLVMELAKDTLESQCGKLSPSQIIHVTLGILDGLAHAHARGVIHRDIKPGNVLLCGDTVKLSDFGLAHALDWEGVGSRQYELVGTPAFMAPEQFEGKWRDYGPWTDLYALGCTVYALFTGEPPFGKTGTIQDFMADHMYCPPPPLPDDMEARLHLSNWLLQLMQKKRQGRFQRAADAAWALLQTESFQELYQKKNTPSQTPNHPSQNQIHPFNEALQTGRQLRTLHALLTTSGPGHTDDTDDTITIKSPLDELADTINQTLPGSVVQWMQNSRPPLPPLWKQQKEETSWWIDNVGLGLYGLRMLPLVGREDERKRLWSKLHETHQLKHAHGFILEGPAGCGKSRLATWFCERTHEVGSSIIFKAIHSQTHGPAHGLAPMLQRQFQCIGLDEHQMRRRMKVVLRSYGFEQSETLETLCKILLTHHESPNQHEKHTKLPAEQRYEAICQLLEHLAQQREVIVWLDDLQWGPDAQGFAHYFLERQALAPFAGILLCTIKEEQLDANMQQQMQALGTHSLMETISIKPLEAEQLSQLIKRLLGLDDELTRQVQKRSQGNPLFAIQLIGDWVQRGILEPGKDGFRIQKGSELYLPDDLHQLWLERITRAVKDLPTEASEALEIAAILGQDVDISEWQDACTHAELEIPTGLLDQLQKQRLAQARQGSSHRRWSFVHDMLRESLERQAQEATRLASHHQACAKMLLSRGEDSQKGRLGYHLLKAGQLSEAMEPLRQGIQDCLLAEDHFRAEELLGYWQTGLEKWAPKQEHEYWGELLIFQSHVFSDRGELSKAMALADQALQLSQQHTWLHIELKALLLKAAKSWQQGKTSEQVMGWFERAEWLTKQAKMPHLLGDIYQGIGDFLVWKGQGQESIPYFNEALKAHKAHKNYKSMGEACRGLSLIYRRLGQFEQARDHISQAIAYFERAEARKGLAMALLILGELERLQGDLDKAKKHYLDSLELFKAFGAHRTGLCEFNLSLILLQQRKYSEAQDTLERIFQSFQKTNHTLFENITALALTTCMAANNEWSLWKTEFPKVTEALKAMGYEDPDNCLCAQLSGELARSANQSRLARQAYLYAQNQWLAIDQKEKADELQVILDELPDGQEDPTEDDATIDNESIEML